MSKSMGPLCEDGHECKKRNSEKTKPFIDVLVTQPARWNVSLVFYMFSRLFEASTLAIIIIIIIIIFVSGKSSSLYRVEKEPSENEKM